MAVFWIIYKGGCSPSQGQQEPPTGTRNVHSTHLMADSINDDTNAHMPAVDNDFLLLFYNLKVEKFKSLVGAEHPA